MYIVLFPDGETWNTVDGVTLQHLPDHLDIDGVEEALKTGDEVGFLCELYGYDILMDAIQRAAVGVHARTFRVEITLGNEAMSEPAHLAAALRQMADQIEISGMKTMPPRDIFEEGNVHDANGTRVGSYGVYGPPTP